MRILHLVHQYPPDFVGGTELYTQAVARAQARRGHDVAVIYRRWAEGTGREVWEDEGVQVWALRDGPLTPSRRALATFRAPKLHHAFCEILEHVDPDLIHIQHLMGFPASVGALAAQRRPSVATLHDYWWFCANAQLLTNYSQALCSGPRAYLNCANCALARIEFEDGWPLRPPLAAILGGRAFLLRRLWTKVSRWVAPTSFVRNTYIDHGLPEERVEVISHGWPVQVEDYQRSASSKRLPDDTVRFIYVGGLAWQKGLHVLIEAFNGVQGNAELLVAGGPTDDEYALRLRARASSRVHFLGQVSRERVAKLLHQGDVVVVPSLWYETFSLLISEAFAAGRPVLASRLGGLVDRVHDGVDGYLIPPGDVESWRITMQRLVDDSTRLQRLKEGVTAPPAFSSHVDKLEDLYRQVEAQWGSP